MLKILSAEQIRATDAYTIQNEPIASIDLMERAAAAFCKWFVSRFSNRYSVYIFCGPGNNGGDGLAIARLLLQENYCVITCVLRFTEKYSSDFTVNYERLVRQFPATIREIKSIADCPVIVDQAILIDALFGTGLQRPLEGLSKEIIEHLNAIQSVIKVAVDIPSGLHADKKSEGVIFQADYTFSFELPKFSFLLPENYRYVGEFYCGSIGLDKNFISRQPSNNYFITRESVIRLLRPRKKFDHKGTFGHALIVGGSKGKMGAVHLAAKAALRTGCGLVTAYIPECGYNIIQSSVPEAMVITDEKDNYLSHIACEIKYHAAGVGPGMGLHGKTAKALFDLLQTTQQPLVLDADALNLLANHPNQLHLIPKNAIITPHPKEFERLFGKTTDHYQRHQLQVKRAIELGIYIVLKGAHTAVATPEGNTYFNSTGNPAMATAGSGDVLTGIITSLLAQGYSPFESTVIGVFIHGLAGDLAAAKHSSASVIASDLINALSEAFAQLEKSSKNH